MTPRPPTFQTSRLPQQIIALLAFYCILLTVSAQTILHKINRSERAYKDGTEHATECRRRGDRLRRILRYGRTITWIYVSTSTPSGIHYFWGDPTSRTRTLSLRREPSHPRTQS